MASAMKPIAWREVKGLSQAELGKRLGVAQASIARYESGRVPEPETVIRYYLATGGQVQPNDFFDLPDLPKLAAPPEEAAA